MAGGQALPGVQGLQLPASAGWVETWSGTRAGTAMGTETRAGKGMERGSGCTSCTLQADQAARCSWRRDGGGTGVWPLCLQYQPRLSSQTPHRHVSLDKRILSLTYL